MFKSASGVVLPLSELALRFMRRPEEVLTKKFEAIHLLDLVRLSFTPQQPRDRASHPAQEKKLVNVPSFLSSITTSTTTEGKAWETAMNKLLAWLKLKRQKPTKEKAPESEPVQLIKSARKLYKCGIKFKTVAAAMSFLDIRFRNGVLKMHNILIDDLLADLFLNFVAFEQYHYWHCSSRHITSYTAFMSCLIRTPEDATFLRDRDIIDNYLRSDEEVCNFFRNLGKDVAIYTSEGYLCELFKGVIKYERNVWHVTWGEFKFKYFDSPWSFVSALAAAVIILLLTMIQTFFAVFEYAKSN